MDTQLAYLAGFVDGEGSIAVGLNKGWKGVRRWYLRFSVHQLDPRPLRLLADLFGGSVRRHGHEARRSRQIFEWVTTSEMAAKAIAALRPYLVVKAEEADVALEFQALLNHNAGRRAPLTVEQEAAREDCYLRLRALKQRTYDET